MKRYNKTGDEPEEKKTVKYVLKSGITWGMIEEQGEITEEVLNKYFEKVD